MEGQKSSEASPDLSFVIPVLNEAASLPQLVREIEQAVQPLAKTYEIIFVDDGSTDQTPSLLSQLHRQNPAIKMLRFRRNFGKSAALAAGFTAAAGQIIFTLDGDLQDDPTCIPEFLAKLDEGCDLVSGWKKKRHDPISKTLPSWVFNQIMSALTGIGLHDFNCGFKCYRRAVVSELHLYGELHRFIPVLASQRGFSIAEIPVSHRPRIHGASKYGWGRMLVGLLDFLTVLFLTGYINRPGQFFGRIGFVVFSVGCAIGLYITYLRVTTGTIEYRYPLLFLGGLLMLGGVQLILSGLLAEMIIHFNRKPQESYALKETLL